MSRFARRPRVPGHVLESAAVPAGERVLEHAEADDGSWLLATRSRLLIAFPVRTDTDGPEETHRSIPWEQVEDAAWDREQSRLRVTEVGEYGAPRPTYTFGLGQPDRLLQLVRERVTASVVLQRRVPVRGKLGLVVIGRRNPTGGPVRWMHAYDAGLDPADPEVAEAADRSLAAARAELGESSAGPI